MIKNDVLGNSKDFNKIRISKSAIGKIYSPDQEIILTGTTKPETEIILSWNNQFGLAESDKNGSWVVNLGLMPEGRYNLEMISDISPESRSIVAAQIIVDNSVKKSDSVDLASFVDGLFNNFIAAVSSRVKVIPEKLNTTPADIMSDSKNCNLSK